ncbi:hypothetical protein LZ32DRAFT_646084 [Colletotrichum eremochloae]|nr:hypothetical protein LZ32DRAFT_646084 [Colletotrichum eremochloae]
MYTPKLPSSREDESSSPSESAAAIELTSRRHETLSEEERNYSFHDTRNSSIFNEQMAFIAPRLSDVSDQHTLNATSSSAEAASPSEQQLTEHETTRLSVHKTSHERDTTAPPRSETTAESVWMVWWMEIFSSVLALGCIIVIVVILSIHQGKPLPSWPRLISINSLISIFTAVFKASLTLPVAEGLGQLKWNWFDRPHKLGDLVLFDNASRGPWGSLQLIMKYIPRPDRGYLAGLGAFITVAALAIDPFSQAIINHESCEVTADFGQAEVSRANNYSGNPQQRYSPYGEALITLNQDMLKAIHRGLTDPPKAGELIAFSCSSGNCTFEQDGGGGYFSSLGICHSCEDITEKVVHVSEQGPKGFMMDTWHLPWSKNATYERLFQGAPNGRILTMTPTPEGAYQNSTPPIYSFDVLSMAKPKCDTCKPGEGKMKPFAAQCRLDPCVKKYSAVVSNGIYEEKVEGDVQMLKRRPSSLHNSTQDTSFALITDSVLVNGAERRYKELDAEADSSVRVGFKDGVFQEVFETYSRVARPENLTWKYYPQECVWFVEKSTWIGMRDSMTELLKGEITTSGTDGPNYEWVDGSLWNKRLFAAGNGSVATVNDLVAGLADSMTATMRSHPYGASEELARNAAADLKVATGRVIAIQTCIYVQWGWIAYPVSLLALQWIFSILVLIACSQRMRPGAGLGRPVWKSSPLALLFHGLDEDVRTKNQNVETTKQMDRLANDVKVRLVLAKDSERNGWKFADI